MAEPAFDLEAVADVEAEERDVHRARSEFERLHCVEACIEFGCSRLGREELTSRSRASISPKVGEMEVM